MKEKKYLIILPLVSLVVTLVFMFMLPDTIEMHFNFSGQADRIGSKYEMFVFPACIVLFGLLPFLDSRAVEGIANKIVFFSIQLILFIVEIVVIIRAYKPEVNVVDIALMCLGLLVFVIGICLPFVTKNSIVGVRTRKTAENDTSWKNVNSFAGNVFMIAGILMVVLVVLGKGSFGAIASLAILFASAIIIFIYSKKA